MKVPDEEVFLFRAIGEGVQMYVCTDTAIDVGQKRYVEVTSKCQRTGSRLFLFARVSYEITASVDALVLHLELANGYIYVRGIVIENPPAPSRVTITSTGGLDAPFGCESSQWNLVCTPSASDCSRFFLC